MDFVIGLVVAAVIVVGAIFLLRRPGRGAPDQPPRDEHPAGADSDIPPYPGELGPSGPGAESEAVAEDGGPAPGTPGGHAARGDERPSADRAP